MEKCRSSDVDVLLVGLDAACESTLESLFEKDAIPTIERLLANGVTSSLTASIPPWTPSAWPTAYTGVNPGKHGVFGFLTFDGYDWDVVNATDIHVPTLWEILDYHDVPSVVVNAPVTHPPPKIDGAVVPGYIAPEDPTCHPEGLLSDIRAELGEYRLYAEGTDLDREERIAEYQRLSQMRGEAFCYLVDRFDPDFGFVQFQQVDTVFHELPGDDAAVQTVYESVDEQIDAILDTCDPDTVIIVSDHGMGEYDGYEFRANEFLANRRFVETARGGSGMPSWDIIWDDQLREGERDSDPDSGPSVLERTLSATAKVGLTSQRIGAVLDRFGLADIVLEHVSGDAVRAASERVSFPDSRAYMRSRIELGVRINLEGREPDGIVPPARYEAVRETLIEVLESAHTPDGDPVFETVGRREEFYEGPHVEDAPDVVTIPTDFEHFISATLPGEEFGQPREPWNHKRDGIVALAGAGVDSSVDISAAELTDVAPTVLAALGLAASDNMDGGVLAPIEPAGRGEYPDLVNEKDASTDDRAVEARLANLGYLEQ